MSADRTPTMPHSRFLPAFLLSLLLLPACLARPASGAALPPSIVAGWDERLALFETEKPVAFDGFGLEDFQGAGSMASALRASDLAAPGPATPLRLLVKKSKRSSL